MSTDSFTQQAAAKLDRLRERCSDAGFRAALRHWLSDSEKRRARAFQALMDVRGTLDDDDFNTVAALYAYHPEHKPGAGSLATVLRALAKPKRGRDGTLTYEHPSFEARLKHLLFCEREALRERLRSVVLAARNNNRMPLDYLSLLKDIHYWGEKVRKDWATDFWGREAEPAAKSEEVTA